MEVALTILFVLSVLFAIIVLIAFCEIKEQLNKHSNRLCRLEVHHEQKTKDNPYEELRTIMLRTMLMANLTKKDR